MTILAIEAVQAHIDDLHREAHERRRTSAARRAGVDLVGQSSAPQRAFWQVRRVLGAGS